MNWARNYASPQTISQHFTNVPIFSLMAIAQNGEVRAVIPTDYGIKYVVDGWIESPDERRALVRTVWVIEAGEQRPRLITAYPAEKSEVDS